MESWTHFKQNFHLPSVDFVVDHADKKSMQYFINTWKQNLKAFRVIQDKNICQLEVKISLKLTGFSKFYQIQIVRCRSRYVFLSVLIMHTKISRFLCVQLSKISPHAITVFVFGDSIPCLFVIGVLQIFAVWFIEHPEIVDQLPKRAVGIFETWYDFLNFEYL